MGAPTRFQRDSPKACVEQGHPGASVSGAAGQEVLPDGHVADEGEDEEHHAEHDQPQGAGDAHHSGLGGGARDQAAHASGTRTPDRSRGSSAEAEHLPARELRPRGDTTTGGSGGRDSVAQCDALTSGRARRLVGAAVALGARAVLTRTRSDSAAASRGRASPPVSIQRFFRARAAHANSASAKHKHTHAGLSLKPRNEPDSCFWLLKAATDQNR